MGEGYRGDTKLSTPEKTPLNRISNQTVYVMTQALLFSIVTFAISATLTPGPNNIMVTASGTNFGYTRTIPHLLGITIGFPIMVSAVGLGIGSMFQTYPILHTILKYIGAGYLIWLAWKIATSHSSTMTNGSSNKNNGTHPLTFLQAASFQWVNPKAWVMAISAVSTYTTIGGNLWLEVTVITAIFALVSYPCISFWTLVGVGAARILRSSRSIQMFNIAMALLLIASIAPIVLS